MIVFLSLMSIDAAQCRMGRAALRWTTGELAKRAAVGIATVNRFEQGGETYASTITKLQQALEAGGVIFVGPGEASLNGGRGVRIAEGAAE